MKLRLIGARIRKEKKSWSLCRRNRAWRISKTQRERGQGSALSSVWEEAGGGGGRGGSGGEGGVGGSHRFLQRSVVGDHEVQ